MVNFDLLLNKELFASEISSAHKCNKELSYSCYQNATILPCCQLPNGQSGGGVLSADGQLLTESTVHKGSHVPYDVDAEEVEEADETVLYFGMLIGIWGHCITDCIKRAWFFQCDDYKSKYANLKIVYTAHEGSLHQNFLELLNCLGIDIHSFTEIKKPTRFKQIIIPDSSFFLDDSRIEQYTKEYRETIDRIKLTVQYECDNNFKKIYYSHRNVRGINNDIGEEKLEKYFRQQGFEIVHPERLSFKQQLELLSRCTVFAASDGSTSHNSIFLPEDAEVIIIPRSPYLTFHQLALNELYEEQKIYYIDATLSILCKGDRPTRGPFFYYVSPNLIEHIENRRFEENDHWVKDNFKDFERYLRRGFYIENNRTFTAKSPYTELSMYYFNKYLFLKKPRKILVSTGRKIDYFISRFAKKIIRLFQSIAK